MSDLRSDLSLISIIIPCRNEEEFIDKCLDSVVGNDYPKGKVEVLVVDGMSDDRTREVIETYTRRYPFIRLLINRKKITASGLNKGIKEARGEYILWISAHNEYSKDYVRKCMEHATRFEADNVGGIIKVVPRNDSFIGKSIAMVLSHPFGVGNSAFRTGTRKPKLVDTVFGGCYKREIFEEIGLFNESLIRGQDMEFSLRMKRAGYKTFLVPQIVSYYHARSDLKTYIQHNFINGLWAIMPMKFVSHMPVALRHLVPLVFVISLVGLGLLSFVSLFFFRVFLLVFIVYFLTNSYFSIKVALKEKDWRCAFLMLFNFTLLHISYGFGSFLGLLRVIPSKQFWENRIKWLLAT
ncbi:MAG: glycosyltransferase family 2 protein, partial [Promethearchaeota archaeon]